LTVTCAPKTTPDIELPVLVLDVSAQEADKILLTLDPLAAMAEADTERIRALLETVRTDSAAVEDLLRRTAGDRLWQILHPHEVNEAEVSPERADELRAKWGTELGQLWQIGPHRISCGDCQDRGVVARLWTNGEPRLRMIWTDPPYGMSYGDKTDWTYKHGGGPSRRAIENDSMKPAELQKLFATALEVARDYAMPGASVYARSPASS
jgi:hypothetical protein